VRDALATGNACPQFASPFSGEGRGAKGIVGDEDCLYLDVYAPRAEPGAAARGTRGLPVMLWIHGGGNSIGRAGFYDGGNLAATHDVVVVAINYRLGPFGWFRHAALRGEGTSAAARSGNFGTLDSIHQVPVIFGTDRDRCTVLWNLTEWRYLNWEQYVAMDVCGSYAYDAYPWPDVAAGQ
jgi:para-nitrobenzyl esterase